MSKTVLKIIVACIAIIGGILFYQHQSKDFTTLQGEHYNLADFKGKWLVVNYFAEWCAPCLREIPELNEFNALTIQNELPIVLFGVSYDTLSDAQLMKIKEKYNIQFSLINTIKKPFPFPLPKYLPATYLIKPDGTVVAQLLGEQNKKSLLRATGFIDAINE